jgi:hypothetical protein
VRARPQYLEDKTKISRTKSRGPDRVRDQCEPARPQYLEDKISRGPQGSKPRSASIAVPKGVRRDTRVSQTTTTCLGSSRRTVRKREVRPGKDGRQTPHAPHLARPRSTTVVLRYGRYDARLPDSKRLVLYPNTVLREGPQMLLPSDQHRSTSARSPRTPSIGSLVVCVCVSSSAAESGGHELSVCRHAS